jgi:protease-4
MKFLGNVLSTIVGLFVFILLFFVGVLLIAALFSGDPDEVTVKSDSVIELNLARITNDYAEEDDPFMSVLSDGENIGLTDIVNAITVAKTDPNIKGISIINDDSNLGMAQRKAVRDALEDFKKSGKFIMAYSTTYSQKEYYLNSVASTIYINPAGDFDFKGMSAELMFFKDLQEKSGIKMEVIRHGKYKSAVEPFLENEMSAANREQTLSLLNSIWTAALGDISISRNIPLARLNEIATGLLARTPEMAKATRLVDVIAYEDEYHDAIRKKLKVKKEDDYNKISSTDYAKNAPLSEEIISSDDKIAVIYAQGEIMGGEGDITTIGEISMNRSLKEARKDKDIKAIVLRIDSPGGAALTSDLIWREIELTKKVKPVVVSMGNYATSGGYYIACNATKIYAEKSTITGSIGVFGVVPNFAILAKKIGVTTQQVKTNNNSADYSAFIPMDSEFRAVSQEGVERVYKTFVSRVATGRKMSVAAVDSIAQGRVWSGEQAIKIGLVDKIGGLDDALKEAAKSSKIKNYDTKNFPEFNKDFKDFIQKFPFVQSKESFVKEELGEETFRLLQQIKKNQARKGVQAMMPYELNIN